MNHLPVSFLTFFMFFIAGISAQERSVHSIKWTIAAKLPASAGYKKSLGLAGAIIGTTNDVLIVGGGSNFPGAMPWQGGTKRYYDEVFIYALRGDKMSLVKQRSKLSAPLAYAACCSGPQGIVYAGGENENGISKKVFLIQWNKKRSAIDIKGLPDLPEATTNAVATLVNDLVFIAGGETHSGATNAFYCLDLKNMDQGWKQLPSLPYAVSHSVLIGSIKNNQVSVYLFGGRKKNPRGISEFYTTSLQFNTSKNHWEKKAPLPYGLSAGTGIMAEEGKILLFGGDRGETFHKVEEKLVAINEEKNEARKQELMREKNELQATHPGFSREVLLYDTDSDTWKIAGTIKADPPVTTIAVKWRNNVLIPAGEIKAGVRTPNILWGKLNFKNK